MRDKTKWRVQSLKTIIVCMISFMTFNFLTTVSVNVFIPAVAELKGMSTAPLYNANTIGNLISVVVVLFVGVLSKRISLKTMSIAGFLLGGISYMLIPTVPAGMTGIFIATNYIATMLYAQIAVGARVGNWFPKRKGEILGIVTAIITVSSLVVLPIYYRVNNAVGIQKTMIIFGGIVVLWAIACIFLIKDNPSDVGLYPENMTQEEAAAAGFDKPDDRTTPWTYGKLLKRPKFLLGSLGWGFSMMGMMGLSLAIVPIMVSKGVSSDDAVTIASFAGLFQLAGSIISGFLDTRIGLRFVITLFLGLEVVGLAIFGFAPVGVVTLLVIGYYIVMFMMGAPNNVQQSMYLSLSGGDGKAFMVIYSLATAIAGALRAITSSIIAWSQTNYESYTPAIMIFLAGSILAIILINICGFRKMELRESEK